MSSRSLRRSAAALAVAALLLPVSGLYAAQQHRPPAPAQTRAAQHHNPIVDFLLRVFREIGSGMDGNG